MLEPGLTKSLIGLATVSTDNAVVKFSGTTGNTQNSGVIVDASNNVTGVGALTASGALVSTKSGGGTSSGFLASAVGASYGWQETGAAADNRVWDCIATGTQLLLRAVNDANSAAGTAIGITRSGTTIGTITLGGPVSVAGQLAPSTNNTRTNGTASLQWSDVRSVLGTFTGLLTASGGMSSRAGSAPSTATSQIAAWASGSIQLLTFIDSARGADEKAWDIRTNAGAFNIELPNDAYSGSQVAMSITRVGNSVGTIALGGAASVAGQLAPTTDNARTLGTAALQWSDVRSVLGTFTGSVTVSSTGFSQNITSPSTSFKNTTNAAGFDIGLLAGAGSADAYIYQRHNASLLFGTNNATRMTIAAAGDITTTAALTVGTTIRTGVYTVASLPAAGTAGRQAFASNGRKNGEGVGAGTGVLVFDDATAWRACDTGATVAA